MKATTIRPTIGLALLLGVCTPATAQEGSTGEKQSGEYEKVLSSVKADLDLELEKLGQLEKNITEERTKISDQLSWYEDQLAKLQAEERELLGEADDIAPDIVRLGKEIESFQKDSTYLSTLFADYRQKFDASLLQAERTLYQEPVEAARLALTNGKLTSAEKLAIQVAMIEASLSRLEETLGGHRFPGQAVDEKGEVQDGQFLVVGPAALFRSTAGDRVGIARLLLGSNKTNVVPLPGEALSQAADQAVSSGAGLLPFDPSGGMALKIAAQEETFLEHVQKGGPVMIPIGIMAALGLLVAIFKWLGMSLVPMPSKKKIRSLLDAVSNRDHEAARTRARGIRGPMGRMLTAGADHLGEPRELVEEVMYEQMLTTRLKLQRFLPFIAICAASAPLLGLLGTVTGIINTFNQIEVAGASDVKNLSGGISEALITTKFGLIVAIPSLLLHAFLSRKARGLTNKLEMAAISFVNHVGVLQPERSIPRGDLAVDPSSESDQRLVKAQVSEILREMLGPLLEGNGYMLPQPQVASASGGNNRGKPQPVSRDPQAESEVAHT